MSFNISNLNPPTRFFYTDSDGNETGEWVDMKRPSLKESREFRKKATKRRAEYKGAQRFEVTDFNDDVWDELFWDATIVDWHIKDDHDNDIPCTKENKLLMVMGSPEFLFWMNKCVAKLNEDFAVIQEESEKNS